MKDTFKTLLRSLFSAISFVMVTVIDCAMWLIAFLNKEVRLVFIGVDNLLDKNDGEAENIIRGYSWTFINAGYKNMIDKLYPTEEIEP